MIYSNLAGTTSKRFLVDPNTNSGQVISGNCYDFNWATKSTVSNASNPNVRLLTNNTDLNLLVSPGQYYVSSNANAATIKNCPTGNAFDLLVMPGNGDGPVTSYTVQIITTWKSEIYIRNTNYNTSAWTEWKKVAYASDIPTLHSVARSGNYNELANKPALHNVATTGNYNVLVNRPTIPTVPKNASGSWTITAASQGTVNSSAMFYNRIGNCVTITGYFSATCANTFANLQLKGLPFTPNNEFIGYVSVAPGGVIIEPTIKIINPYLVIGTNGQMSVNLKATEYNKTSVIDFGICQYVGTTRFYAYVNMSYNTNQ